eukprot:3275087-Pleurochrysis_carterae.AAC.1
MYQREQTQNRHTTDYSLLCMIVSAECVNRLRPTQDRKAFAVWLQLSAIRVEAQPFSLVAAEKVRLLSVKVENARGPRVCACLCVGRGLDVSLPFWALRQQLGVMLMSLALSQRASFDFDVEAAAFQMARHRGLVRAIRRGGGARQQSGGSGCGRCLRSREEGSGRERPSGEGVGRGRTVQLSGRR